MFMVRFYLNSLFSYYKIFVQKAETDEDLNHAMRERNGKVSQTQPLRTADKFRRFVENTIVSMRHVWRRLVFLDCVEIRVFLDIDIC